MEDSDGAERWWRPELVVRGGGGFRGCREVVED